MDKKSFSVGHKDGVGRHNTLDNLEWIPIPMNGVSDGTGFEDVDERRSDEDIADFLEEAFDKVYLTRTHPCDIHEVEESRRRNLKRISKTYSDIPEEGYNTWECGYWNGVLGALRWVLGDPKHYLDT